MISLQSLIIAISAGAIPAIWFFFCRWFMKLDEAETELLDKAEAAELTDGQRAERAGKA